MREQEYAKTNRSEGASGGDHGWWLLYCADAAFTTRAAPALLVLPYRPTINRSARMEGRPASWIFLCAVATS